MKPKILIVEDQYIEADYLRMMLTTAGYPVCTIARSVAQAQVIIKNENPKLVLLDIFLKGKFTGIDLAKQLKEEHIAFIYLSANSNEEVLTAAKATEPYGFLVKPFREKDLLVSLEIAFYLYEQSWKAKWQTEMQVKKELLHIEQTSDSWAQKLLHTARALQRSLSFDCLFVSFQALEGDHASLFALLRIGFDEYQVIGFKELCTISGEDPEKIRRLLRDTPGDSTAGWYNGDDFKSLFATHPMKALLANTFGFASHLVLPFLRADSAVFSVNFFRRIPDGYNAEKMDWLFRLQQPLSVVMSNIAAAEKKQAVFTNDKPATEKKEKVSNIEFNVDSIVGSSSALLQVMDMIHRVAPADTSVLILGESGTGKEKIADEIHRLSRRKGQPFVKVNCAALPAALIETELFGHEKGAFTGAIEKRTGKFERADKGTIFLDEIGELPLELQVKLLRVLQEKEIERVGAQSSIKIDVRIIAATNRNLEKEVAEGRFRLDLYYRLNVFPILLPPLRDRKEDLPALIAHFIDGYSKKAGKKISGVADKALKKMMAYDWPGNIRELEHFIERHILLAKSTIIEDINLPVLVKEQPDVTYDTTGRIKTIDENERDHILAVLKKSNGKIWGPAGAAEILNLHPSTLRSKMHKLGLKKGYSE